MKLEKYKSIRRIQELSGNWIQMFKRGEITHSGKTTEQNVSWNSMSSLFALLYWTSSPKMYTFLRKIFALVEFLSQKNYQFPEKQRVSLKKHKVLQKYFKWKKQKHIKYCEPKVEMNLRALLPNIASLKLPPVRLLLRLVVWFWLQCGGNVVKGAGVDSWLAQDAQPTYFLFSPIS